jgi:hypothetical protein
MELRKKRKNGLTFSHRMIRIFRVLKKLIVLSIKDVKSRGGMMMKVTIVIAFLTLFSIILIPEEMKLTIIKDPKPTCEEKVFTELRKVGEVVDTMESKAFLVAPRSVVADNEGNIYLFESMLKKVHKYNRELELLFTFAADGTRPGETGGVKGFGTDTTLFLGKDNLLYAGDRKNRRIICFHSSGKPLETINIYIKPPGFMTPVVDSKGNFYLHSSDDSVIDVYDSHGMRLASLINRDELSVGLFYSLKSAVSKKHIYGRSTPMNVLHEIIRGDRLLVFSQTSGKFFIVKDNKVIKKLNLWPRDALEFYKKKLWTAIEGEQEFEAFTSFFLTLFADRDDERYFYLHFGKPESSQKNYLYKFDLEGKLDRVLFINEPSSRTAFLTYKRNGLFYGVGYDEKFDKSLVVYKEQSK